MQLSGFNISYETSYDSGIKKSNGFFFLEPSFYSQFMALIFIVEFHGKRRPAFLLAYMAAFLSAYSGSGFIIIFMWALYIIFGYKSSIFFRFAVFFVLFFLVSIVYFTLPEVGRRATEIFNEGTSGYIRYTAPVINYLAMQDSFGLREFMFGLGPGSSEDFRNFVSEANYLSLLKALIEYGVPFAVAYMAWWITYIRKSLPAYMRAPIIGFLFISSSTFLQPLPLMTVWLFAFFSPNTSREVFSERYVRAEKKD